MTSPSPIAATPFPSISRARLAKDLSVVAVALALTASFLVQFGPARAASGAPTAAVVVAAR